MYSCVLARNLSKVRPRGFVRTVIWATKFSSPKTSFINSFRFATSRSSIEMKITPSSVSRFRARNNRGYIIDSQALWNLPDVSGWLVSRFPSESSCLRKLKIRLERFGIVVRVNEVISCIVRGINVDHLDLSEVRFVEKFEHLEILTLDR